MPPKENLERACEECIHYWACSRQCGEPMAQSSATGCECYETVKSSMAYYVGTLDGVKGKIPNRLREIAEADKDGRVVVLPCNGYSDIEIVRNDISYKPDHWNIHLTAFAHGQNTPSGLKVGLFDIGEVERAMEEMEAKKDGNETSM